MDSMKAYRFSVVIEGDGDGFFANCPELQGCYSQGKTYDEAFRNIQDAVRLHLEDRLQNGEPIPAPSSVTLASLEIAV
jgi:predicted RNase H-like HicB family nuclease